MPQTVPFFSSQTWNKRHDSNVGANQMKRSQYELVHKLWFIRPPLNLNIMYRYVIHGMYVRIKRRDF